MQLFSKQILMKMLLSFAAYLAFFFAPISQILVAVGVLVFTDLITGIKAAKHRGEVIRSNGLQRTVGKTIFYFIAIMLSRVMELYFVQWLPITNITAGYIALAEFKSNMENIGSYTGVDVWNYLKDKINIKKP
jgi:phage-related holin